MLSLSLLAASHGFVVAVAASRMRDQRLIAAAGGLTVLGMLGVVLAPTMAASLWARLLGFGAGFKLALTLTVLRAPTPSCPAWRRSARGAASAPCRGGGPARCARRGSAAA